MHRAMTEKPALGPKHASKAKYHTSGFHPKHTTADITGKVRVYIPELKANVYVNPGTDIKGIVEKYMAVKAFNKKTLH